MCPLPEMLLCDVLHQLVTAACSAALFSMTHVGTAEPLLPTNILPVAIPSRLQQSVCEKDDAPLNMFRVLTTFLKLQAEISLSNDAASRNMFHMFFTRSVFHAEMLELNNVAFQNIP